MYGGCDIPESQPSMVGVGSLVESVLRVGTVKIKWGWSKGKDEGALGKN